MLTYFPAKYRSLHNTRVSSSYKYSQRHFFSFYNIFLILTTATITWTISYYLHKSVNYLDHVDPSPFQLELEYTETQNVSISEKKNAKNIPFNYSDYRGPSKVYTKFVDPFPCFMGEKQLMLNTPSHEGILFHRPQKTGSTTITGIILRLVHNRGRQQYGFEKCKHRSIHGSGKEFEFVKRDRTKSILLSIIREPTARALSEIFHFEVTVYLHEPTDEFIKQNLLRGGNYMRYFTDLGVRTYDVQPAFGFAKELAAENGNITVEMHDTALLANGIKVGKRKIEQIKNYWKFGVDKFIHNLTRDILDDYDLILIMERMDESLVAFQMLFNLTTKEILYTRARSSGSFSNGFSDRPCVYIIPTFKSTGLKKFIASDEWQRHIAPDIEFYKAAHKSLDRTIEALGRTEFEAKLATFRKALKLAARNCEGRVKTMCTNGGKRIFPKNTTCYIWGEGCDHDCIDELDI